MKFSKGDTLGYVKYDELQSNLNSQKQSFKSRSKMFLKSNLITQNHTTFGIIL